MIKKSLVLYDLNKNLYLEELKKIEQGFPSQYVTES